MELHAGGLAPRAPGSLRNGRFALESAVALLHDLSSRSGLRSTGLRTAVGGASACAPHRARESVK
jgi:hypothetical protein